MAKAIKTAVFSDGTRDEYRGHRDVTAAWAIFDKESGKVLASGHSLDRVRATKTAEGNVADVVRCDLPSFHLPASVMRWTPPATRYTAEALRAAGLLEDGPAKPHAIFRAAKAANAARREAQRARVRIEIVDL